MLRWRLLVGTLVVAILVGAAWVDHLTEVRCPRIPIGIWLLPVGILFAVGASRELLQLAASAGLRPVSCAVYCGNVLLVLAGWLSPIGSGGGQTAAVAARTPWVLLALAVGVTLALLGEMLRYRRPGGVTVNLAVAVFALVYVGLMLSLAVQLRMVWGLAGLASLLIVVKMGDTGAYTVGRLMGRHRMAPVLSPGKTIEGAIGGLVFNCVGSWATFTWLVAAAARPEPWRWILFGLLVGIAGLLGDLAESLLKRDVGWKDSGRWLPGLGGVLDVLDSVLLAAPVAWACWAMGLVGG
jgi:phosphatidate cytidylyltransferase